MICSEYCVYESVSSWSLCKNLVLNGFDKIIPQEQLVTCRIFLALLQSSPNVVPAGARLRPCGTGAAPPWRVPRAASRGPASAPPAPPSPADTRYLRENGTAKRVRGMCCRARVARALAGTRRRGGFHLAWSSLASLLTSPCRLCSLSKVMARTWWRKTWRWWRETWPPSAAEWRTATTRWFSCWTPTDKRFISEISGVSFPFPCLAATSPAPRSHSGEPVGRDPFL